MIILTILFAIKNKALLLSSQDGRIKNIVSMKRSQIKKNIGKSGGKSCHVRVTFDMVIYVDGHSC